MHCFRALFDKIKSNSTADYAEQDENEEYLGVTA